MAEEQGSQSVQASMEQLEARYRGERGDPGIQGLPGNPGISRLGQLAVVVLLALVLIMGVGSLLSSYLQSRSFLAGQRHEQVVQRAEGLLIERKLCTTLARFEPLSQLQAPVGNPLTNPSRSYEQKLNLDLKPLAQLGPDVGCRR